MLCRRAAALLVLPMALGTGGLARGDNSLFRPQGGMHIVGALEGGALVTLRGSARRDDGVVLGVLALGLAEASPRGSVGVGAVLMPWKGLLTFGLPARIEWAPLGDRAAVQDAPGGAVALFLHGGTRVMFAQPVAVDTPAARDRGGLGRFRAAGGVLGEVGFSLRSEPMRESDGYRLDISFSGLLGPLSGYHTGAGDAPLQGLYAGGSLSFGVML